MNNLALIISRKDYRENDLLVNLYSQEKGKQTLLVRGAKKFKSKLASHIEPLTVSEILIINTKSLNYLASAKSKETFSLIKSSYTKLALAGKVLNIFNQSVKENEADRKLFNFLVLWLKKLELAKKEDLEYLFLLFMIRFLDILGYLPNFTNCQKCQKKLISGQQIFSFSSGSLLCRNCQQNKSDQDFYKLSENSVKLFRFLVNNQEKIIVKKSLIKELNIFLYKFWQYHQN